MSAYIVVNYDIDDPDGYAPYVPAVLPLLQKHGAEVLVADYAAKAIEGQCRSVSVILRFDSEEAALNFYNDPDYEPVRKIRLDSTVNGTLLLAKGFVPPSRS